MSKESNNQGRAYEYICIVSLEKEIKKMRPVTIENNSSFEAAHHAWNSINIEIQNVLLQSAASAVETIFELEPLILENDGDIVTLKIQPDSQGEIGDVRDILIIRKGIEWEIGLSVKHNHFAVKHSRLAKTLDFGDRWFGVKCSDNYWQDIAPIFKYLDTEKSNRSKWSDLPNKENDVYIPLLNAFMDEISKSYKTHPDIPKKLVEYLLGQFNFYKVISIDNKRTTQIQTYNLRGTLNKSGRKTKAKCVIPVSNLPTRIVNIGFKPNSNNTVELYLDGGWQFSFRIHNASTYVETSLKFDVQIIGMPTTIISINCLWK